MPTRRRSGKKIDFVHWTGFAGQFLAQGVGTVAVNLLPAQHEPETLMRTRGELSVWKDGASTPPLAALVSVGIIVVPENTGTTVLWSSATDLDAPWIWFWNGVVGYEEMVIDTIDVPGLSNVRKEIDSKAMRILRKQEVQLVMNNTTLAGAMLVNLSAAGRILSGT